MEQQGGNQGFQQGFGNQSGMGFSQPNGMGGQPNMGGQPMGQQSNMGGRNVGPNQNTMGQPGVGPNQGRSQQVPSMSQQFRQSMSDFEEQLNQQANKASNQFKDSTTDLNWDYNKEGALGFRLIAYAAVANLMFMCGLTTGLSILFAVVAIVEKDKKLTRIVASMLATVLILQIGVDLWDLIEVPLSASLGKLRDLFNYGNVAYKGVNGMVEGIRFVDKIVNWLYHVALICIGMMNMKKITTGTYKTSKYITKYF